MASLLTQLIELIEVIVFIRFIELIKFTHFVDFFLSTNQPFNLINHYLCPMHDALCFNIPTSAFHIPNSSLFFCSFFASSDIAEGIFADQVHDIRRRIGIGDGVPVCQHVAPSAGVDRHIFVTDQAFRFN